MVASSLYLSNLASKFPIPIQCHSQTQPMFSLCAFIFFFTFSLFICSFSVFKILRKTEQKQQTQNDLFELKRSLSETLGKTHLTHENDPTHIANPPHKLLVEILPSDSPKWASLFVNREGGDPDDARSGLDVEKLGSGGDQRVKKKKRRAKKKSSSHLEEEEEDNCFHMRDKENSGPGLGSRVHEELVCFYPFTSSSSATQRKIKQQYDELMECHESKKLTLAQVGQFANCLVAARNELQHKADVIQRKFTITKALLFKADRSSFDRLRQQICKLELEQKRLEEDASVYNWLQQQLKLSPAYKKMLEISACMELKAKSREQVESTDEKYSEISFEELLAQEKKDSFWQKNRKSRSCSS
ncbi:uncharacterized protein LOC110767812 [Prunus avium]|uniref:Uncharacterized protein LOC110767812 n=1 Tax=Prunus avium TaxID=42229 RepID=A0A6P5TJA7_PRUAV|nr:uncharacterized protein LOC110767812 [Prunus avium]